VVFLTRHAVVAYPTLEEPDRAWIEAIRQRHDPQAGLLPAHFTLVFPAPADRDVLRREVARAAATAGSFHVQLNRVVSHRDAPGSPSHVFLTSDDGGDDLRALHLALYDSVLSQWLDLRIPYLPHVTVAAGLTDDEAVSLAEELNRRPVGIACVIDALTIVAIDDGRVSTVAVVPLERVASR